MKTWPSSAGIRLPAGIDRFVDRHCRLTTVASLTFLATAAALLLFGYSWVEDDRTASVRVLGSGNRLSVLVVADDARLLIAAGDDASAFSNALSAALHPTSRRVDVILLSGDANDKAVAARVRRDYPDAVTYMMRGELNSAIQDFGLSASDVLARPARFSLPGGIDVTVDPGSEQTSWSAEIRTGETFVFVTSEPKTGALPREQPTAIVYTRKLAKDAALPIAAEAIVVPGSSEISDETFAMGASPDAERWLVRVYDAGVERLTFTGSGLGLPASAVPIATQTSRVSQRITDPGDRESGSGASTARAERLVRP